MSIGRSEKVSGGMRLMTESIFSHVDIYIVGYVDTNSTLYPKTMHLESFIVYWKISMFFHDA